MQVIFRVCGFFIGLILLSVFAFILYSFISTVGNTKTSIVLKLIMLLAVFVLGGITFKVFKYIYNPSVFNKPFFVQSKGMGTPPQSIITPKTLKFDATPDGPEAFGYKSHWFVIKVDNNASVIETLGLSDVQVVNWATGIAVAHHGIGEMPQYDDFVFISPPIKGWVFIVSSHLGMSYHPEEPFQANNFGFDLMFSKLYTKFSDVQFFGSHRVVGQVDWARARNGRIERMFGCADEIYANIGKQTIEEKALNLLDTSGLTLEKAYELMAINADAWHSFADNLIKNGASQTEAYEQADKMYPLDSHPSNEDIPLKIAATWSISPDTLEELNLPNSVGFIAKLPASLLEQTNG